jgi:hypothetical protein
MSTTHCFYILWRRVPLQYTLASFPRFEIYGVARRSQSKQPAFVAVITLLLLTPLHVSLEQVQRALSNKKEVAASLHNRLSCKVQRRHTSSGANPRIPVDSNCVGSVTDTDTMVLCCSTKDDANTSQVTE